MDLRICKFRGLYKSSFWGFQQNRVSISQNESVQGPIFIPKQPKTLGLHQGQTKKSGNDSMNEDLKAEVSESSAFC